MILNKPRPTYSNQARKEGIGGTIRVRLTFSENGSISRVIFLTALPGGLNRNSFFTALKMRFLPAEKDGVFDTVTKTVEFSFAIY
jgi:TonB family protein